MMNATSLVLFDGGERIETAVGEDSVIVYEFCNQNLLASNSGLFPFPSLLLLLHREQWMSDDSFTSNYL